MDNFNWVREYNKLFETLNSQGSYFSGSKFISVIREFDPYHLDYNQYINYRKQEGLSTSRKNFFYDILTDFKDDVKMDIIARFYEIVDIMKKESATQSKEDVIEMDWAVPARASNQAVEDTFAEVEVAEKNIDATETIPNPIVFISYSWDDEDHKNWILKLAKRLSENGVEVILDRWELKPGSNVLYFMDQAIPKADKVLIIFTPNYKLKAEKRQGGVGYEYSILNMALYKKIADNEKFIPVLKSGSFDESIPDFIQQFIAVWNCNNKTDI